MLSFGMFTIALVTLVVALLSDEKEITVLGLGRLFL
ncbi:putative holin-like toxin [Enterococcus mundtii]